MFDVTKFCIEYCKYRDQIFEEGCDPTDADNELACYCAECPLMRDSKDYRNHKCRECKYFCRERKLMQNVKGRWKERVCESCTRNGGREFVNRVYHVTPRTWTTNSSPACKGFEPKD